MPYERFGSAFDAARYCSMAAINSGTLSKLPRRTRFSVSSRNHRSTRFSHDELVGMKWEGEPRVLVQPCPHAGLGVGPVVVQDQMEGGFFRKLPVQPPQEA